MKKGISLITLIITIVVVIILAAAVILALSGNNPINNARIANLISTKDSIESGVLAYTSKIKSKTLGVVDTYGGLTGVNTEDSYRIIEKNDEVLVTCEVTKDDKVITLYKIDKNLFKQNIDKLPSPPNSKCEWYLDEEGHVFLVFEENGLAPKWMTNKQGVIDDSTLLTFVVYKGGEIGKGVDSGKVEIPKEKEWYEKIEEADADWFTYSGSTVTGFSASRPVDVTEIKLPTKKSDGTEVTAVSVYGFRGTNITALIIPGTIKYIGGEEAFKNCTSLEKLKIEEGVENLGLRSFVGCTALKEVILPKTVTSFNVGSANSTFKECTAIEKITIPNSVAKTNVRELFCGSVSTIKEIKFQDDVVTIGSSAFQNFKALTSIELPETLQTIGSYAFANTSLKEIKIPSSLTNLGGCAFSNCVNVTQLEIPGTLKTIGGEDAFRNCTNLEKLIVDEGVENLGLRSFEGCTALKEVVLPKSVTSFSVGSANSTFKGCTAIEKITIPNNVAKTSVRELFCSSTTTIKDIKFQDDVVTIGSSAFQNFTAITSMDLPKNLQSIGSYAFAGTKLKSIKLPSSLTNLGGYAFYNCIELNSINLQDCVNLGHLGDDCFSGDVSLVSVELPESPSINVHPRVFKNCKGLKYVTLPSTLKTMYSGSSNGVFIGCTGLEKITCRGSKPSNEPWGAPTGQIVVE